MFDITNKKVGFIGGGNMAYAVAVGIVRGGGIDPKQVFVSNRSKGKLDSFSAEGINVTQDNIEVLSKCDIVFLCVKPYIFPIVEEEIKKRKGNIDLSTKIFMSMMGGVKMAALESALGKGSRVIRTMPNTPCLALAGTIMVCKNENIKDDEHTGLKNMMSACAECYDIEEDLIGPSSAVMGCAPAYFYVAIEALADGGVMHGLPRPLALKLASRAVMGAGKLAYESDMHPEQLKDAVASPKGSTIRGLHAIEKGGFRAALIDATIATCSPK